MLSFEDGEQALEQVNLENQVIATFAPPRFFGRSTSDVT